MNKLKQGMPGLIAVVVVCVCGMYVTFGMGSGTTQAGAVAETTFDETGLYEPDPEIDDGYNHLMVEVPPTEAIEPTSEFLTEAGIDLGGLEGYDDTATIERDGDDALWATFPDGDQVLLSADGTEVPSIDKVIAELEADPDVHEVRRIDDQTISVVTTHDSTTLGTLVGLAVTEDEPTIAFETDPYFPYQWGLENTAQQEGYVEDADIDAGDAWPASSRGSGVLVAVLDTGVDFGHPDLAARQWTNPGEDCSNGTDDDNNGFIDDCHGWDFVYNDAFPWDGNNNFHGTHVAGIVAATNDSTGVIGVAPNATVMDLRILDAQGRGFTSTFASAIRYAVDNGAQVINMSVGTNPGVPRSNVTPVESAVQYARDNGVLIVTAAGNDNVDVDSNYVWPASFGQFYDNVATIASTDYGDNRSGFSNYGSSTVDMGAPGSRILSSTIGGNWSYASGTSMAAPMFAGAAALVYGDGLATTPTATVARLVSSADVAPALDGKVKNAVRLNIGNLFRTTEVDPVRIDATGLHSLVEGTPIDASLHIRVNDVEGFAAQGFRWEARLLTAIDGEAHGVFEHPVTVDGQPTSTTDQALFALSSGTSLITDPGLAGSGRRIDVGTSLPAGSYALLVEAVATDDPTSILAPPNMLFFEVAPEPETPPTTQPQPTTSTTAASTTSTTVVSTSTTVVSTSTTVPPSPTTIGGTPTTTSTPTTTTTTAGPPTTVSSTTTSVTPTTLPSSTTTPQTSTTTGPVPTTQPPWEWTPTTSTTTTMPPSSTTTVPPTTVSSTTTGPTTTTTMAPPASTSTTAGPTTTQLEEASTTTASTTTTSQPLRNGIWEIYDFTPDNAPVGSNPGHTGITGRFPAAPKVVFGDQVATPLLSSRTYLLVAIPPTMEPGPVTVSLKIGATTVLVVPDAFTFTGSAPTTTTTTTSTPPSTTPGTTTPANPTTTTATTTTTGPTPTTIGGNPSTTSTTPRSTTTAPSNTVPSTTAPSSTTVPGSPTTTVTPPTTSTTAPGPTGRRGPRPAFSFEPSFDFDNGLKLGRISEPSNPTGDIPPADWPSVACTPTSCSGREM
ncbi:MAG: S8 family serine peptidase [Actinomycetia bacterium]|nr:S8 family serine peptidase [Actinomycetes bacterium]